MIRVGCCGFPGGMEKYFKKFKLVEVQKTFYKPPKIETAEKWREKAPKDFEFSLKAWQLITHPASSPTYRKAGITISEDKKEKYGYFKPTEEVFEAWEKTIEIASALNSKIVVFQCPPGFKPTEENINNMKEFFNSAERRGLSLAWEPRGGWDDQLIANLCHELKLVHCVDPMLQKPAYRADITYFRLHGSYEKGKINYNYKYTDEDLRKLSKMLQEMEGEIYVLFNNLYMGEDAERFLISLGL
jgi:uncharacterized protein YecE (DUF72 family)